MEEKRKCENSSMSIKIRSNVAEITRRWKRSAAERTTRPAAVVACRCFRHADSTAGDGRWAWGRGGGGARWASGREKGEGEMGERRKGGDGSREGGGGAGK